MGFAILDFEDMTHNFRCPRMTRASLDLRRSRYLFREEIYVEVMVVTIKIVGVSTYFGAHLYFHFSHCCLIYAIIESNNQIHGFLCRMTIELLLLVGNSWHATPLAKATGRTEYE